MTHHYFLIIDEAQAGPFTYEELFSKNLTPDTLVWRQGLDDWTRAALLEEMAEVLAARNPAQDITAEQPTYGPNNQKGQQPNFGANPQYGRQPNFGANPQYGNQPNYGNNPQYGPNPQYGNQPNYGNNRPYGQQPNYGPNREPNYGNQPNYGMNNPQYGNQPNYGNNQQYGQQPNYGRNQYPGTVRQNWLTLAIIATVCGFLFSCIGGIFGIVGIVQANKANDSYAMGYDSVGDAANSTAKTMTIISFILAGVGLVINGFAFFGGLMNAL